MTLNILVKHGVDADLNGDGVMSPDEWQAHVTTKAALAMGRWLEARGRLDREHALLDPGEVLLRG